MITHFEGRVANLEIHNQQSKSYKQKIITTRKIIKETNPIPYKQKQKITQWCITPENAKERGGE